MSKPSGEAREGLPVACTLGPGDGRQRRQRWRTLVDAAAPVASRHGRMLEVRFDANAGVLHELTSLAAAEQQCCSFVSWTVGELDGAPVLRVLARPESPDDVAAIAALFAGG